MVPRTVTICSGWTMRCGGWYCVSAPLTGLGKLCCAKLGMLDRNRRKETVLRQAIIEEKIFGVNQLGVKKLISGCEIPGFWDNYFLFGRP